MVDTTQPTASAVASAAWANYVEATVRARLTDDALTTDSGSAGVSRGSLSLAADAGADYALAALRAAAPDAARWAGEDAKPHAPTYSDVALISAQAMRGGGCSLENDAAACVDLKLRMRAMSSSHAREIEAELPLVECDSGANTVMWCKVVGTGVHEYMNIHDYRVEAQLHIVYPVGSNVDLADPSSYQWSYKEDARFSAAVAGVAGVEPKNVKLEGMDYELDCDVHDHGHAHEEDLSDDDGSDSEDDEPAAHPEGSLCMQVLFHVGAESEAVASDVLARLDAAAGRDGGGALGELGEQLKRWTGLGLSEVHWEAGPYTLAKVGETRDARAARARVRRVRVCACALCVVRTRVCAHVSVRACGGCWGGASRRARCARRVARVRPRELPRARTPARAHARVRTSPRAPHPRARAAI